jgi:hypothetical protein
LIVKRERRLNQSEVSMNPQFYGYLGVLLLLLSGVRMVWRKGPKPDDWELLVAFIRLDFPPHQRDTAQKIATGLAEIVGLKIKELRPEHTIQQIADWADDRIHAKDLINLFVVAFGVRCDASATFRDLVEKVSERGIKNAKGD